VVGTHQPTNEHLGRNWSGEKVPIEIVLETRADHPNYGKRVIVVEGKQLGPLQQDSPALPIGTRAEAYIISPPSASVTATTAKGNTLKITQLQNHGWPERTWKKEQAIITIGLRITPTLISHLSLLPWWRAKYWAYSIRNQLTNCVNMAYLNPILPYKPTYKAHHDHGLP
jgi:hypothetical protein